MKYIIKTTMIFLVAVILIASGCSSSKKGQCGCPAKTGFVGY